MSGISQSTAMRHTTMNYKQASKYSKSQTPTRHQLTSSLLFVSIEQLIFKFNEENQGNQHRYISSCGRYIYNLAIIDYLQSYDFEKWGEHQLKVWIYRRDGSLISACNPNPYARRYLHFMREFVIIN